MTEPSVVIACAVWGNWPASRVFVRIKNRPTGPRPHGVPRGGQANMQAEYIRRLAGGVARNAPANHRFICFADDTAKVPEGVEAWPLDVPRFSRALPKAYIYGAPFTGCPIPAGTPILVLDLDNVVVGDLSPLIKHGHELVARERGYKLPQLVPDGDIVYAVAGSDAARRCADLYHHEMETNFTATDRGDERVLLAKVGAKTWAEVAPGRVLSYKRHLRQKHQPPEDASVVSFHGRPLPDQVKAEWVKRHWQP